MNVVEYWINRYLQVVVDVSLFFYNILNVLKKMLRDLHRSKLLLVLSLNKLCSTVQIQLIGRFPDIIRLNQIIRYLMALMWNSTSHFGLTSSGFWACRNCYKFLLQIFAQQIYFKTLCFVELLPPISQNSRKISK